MASEGDWSFLPLFCSWSGGGGVRSGRKGLRSGREGLRGREGIGEIRV